MKCHYEVLDVSSTASEDELRKSYRKLALKWHPDKNPDNVEDAKQQFLLVQQAYDVLSDPQERAWYDKHRNEILQGAGSGYKDDSLDVYPFFSGSCFQNFNDDENGFYTVYKEVFNKLAAEESEYMTVNDTPLPDFGTSTSSYDVINKFYGYWSSFCTKKSYYWLNIYQISEAENRRMLRLMEQENKKVRDKAKKERNEIIRALVSFVRKRDKRVKAHASYLEQKIITNRKKAEENQKKMIAKHRQEIETYKECEWSKFSNLEKELEEIESTLDSEFKDESSDSEIDDLYCVACGKYFRTEKAFANHEKSKKHKEKVILLRETVLVENEYFNSKIVESDVIDNLEVDNAKDFETDDILENENITKSCCDTSETEFLHIEKIQEIEQNKKKN